MNVCTIIAKNYAAHARVLANSFEQVHPDGTFTVLVVDEFAGFLDPAEEPFELLGIEEIGLPDAEGMAAGYDVTELSTAVKPWLLRHLLDRDGVDSITYLDPDIWIADSIEEVATLASEHGAVLTPHFTAPLPRDGLKPSEEDILIAGTYNLGFISLGAGETADQLLAWWSERLERHCVIDPGSGLFVDQRWIDLAPGIWPGVQVLRDPGYNVAYWNLPRRELSRSGDAFFANGEPLRFFHYSGFDPFRPGVLSKHQNRIEVSAVPVLSTLCEAQAERLLASGHEEAGAWPYGWEALPNGVRLDRVGRRLYREGRESGALAGSAFEREGGERLLSYLTEVPEGSGVTRYAKGLRDSRPDLREAFPDVEGRDALAFNRWLLESADSLGISAQLLPAPRSPGRRRAATGKDGGGAEPGTGRGRLGVNLIGYLNSERGVGEAARLVGSALAARELPTAEIDIPVEEAKLPAVLSGLTAASQPFDVNLLCVNADMLPSVARAAPGHLFEGRHSAGLWFWEVERFPERWRGSFDHLDEVWTASEFVAEALRPLAPVPVKTIRVPVTPGEPGEFDRADLSMPDGFCFLFVFDYRSVLRRKNPLGLIEAFKAAFDPGSGASLLLKTVGAEDLPEQAAELAAAAAEHPDIHLVEGVISVEEKNAMIANCDCYVSLHRSEGLGLTMAEAMYFGKPVIATGYSGNLDFMNEENSYLVDFSLEQIGDGAEPYPSFARWAEPRPEHAVEQMRAVFDDREEAARRGALGAEQIRATHSPEAAGSVLEERLTDIRRNRVIARLSVPDGPPGSAAGAGLVPLPAPLPIPAAAADPAGGQALMHHLLRFEQPPPRDGSGPLRRFVKRLYLRLLRPYASYQRRVNLSIRESLDELGAEFVAVERRLATANEASAEKLREEVAGLERRLRSLDAGIREEGAARGKDLKRAASLIEAMEGRLRSSLDEQSEEVGGLREGLASLRPEIARVDEALASFAASAEEAQARTRQELTRTEEALARDRAFVDALRSQLDRVATGTEDELGSLRTRLEGTGGAPADAAKPYMADDRFGPRSDPTLGTVIGFEGHASNGAPRGYRGFEDLFRGPEQMIRERQEVYLPLAGDCAPVLDAGCGRGEFLDLLRDAEVEAQGVDLDPGMVARCREKGHEVEQADLLERLQAEEPGSLGCIFSAQVIEHLDAEELQRFMELSAERLRPGGRLIVETVNPHCAAALKAFWVDPTHQQPLFPETILALCQLAGFSSAYAFCPLGNGDWESDRLTQGEYAVVATLGE